MTSQDKRKTLKSGIEPRFYRSGMGKGRFESFVVGYKDSDLWIGIDPESYSSDIPAFAKKTLTGLRTVLEKYLDENPGFAISFTPVKASESAPDIAIQMTNAGKLANTGPMAAVAGAIAEFMGREIINKFKVKEIAIENGGDLFLSLQKNMVLSVYAGNSPLSGKVGIEIEAAKTPVGVCTSAGTVGPSISLGNADAVMVACKNTALADAFATAIGNTVKTDTDIEPALEMLNKQPEILSILIICNGKIGIKGQFKLKLLTA